MIEAAAGDTRTTPGGGSKSKPREATEVHTRLLRLALGMQESRGYWEHVDPEVPVSKRAVAAFEGRWFGGKSLERTKYLILACGDRYDAFPEALHVLRRWRAMTLETRQVICHWHLQLSDPLYRRFSSFYLNERRSLQKPQVDRNSVHRWIKSEHPDRWSEATCVQFASKLLSAASEAGLISPKRDPRTLMFPKVPDVALAYLMYLLRGVRFEGSLTDNPYVSSVGLEGGFLDQRLRGLPGITFKRMGHLAEFEWVAPDLVAWAKETL